MCFRSRRTLGRMLPTDSKVTGAANVARRDRVRYPAPRERVANYVCKVALRHGLQPATLHKFLHNGERGAAQLLSEIIREGIRDGKRHKVQPFADHIEAAARELTDSVILTNGLILQKVIADLDEDGHREAFILNRCDATRKTWRRHLEIERSLALECWSAL